MSNSLFTLSSADLRKAAELQARIEQLQAQLADLVGSGRNAQSPAARTDLRRRSVPEARRKHLSAIAKARWKKAKAAGKNRL